MKVGVGLEFSQTHDAFRGAGAVRRLDSDRDDDCGREYPGGVPCKRVSIVAPWARGFPAGVCKRPRHRRSVRLIRMRALALLRGPRFAPATIGVFKEYDFVRFGGCRTSLYLLPA